MKRETLRRAIEGMVLVCCMTAAAQDKGYWRATSSTAKSITVDVALSDVEFFINVVSFTIFFFQAEDGIRDKLVTGVQTCALPISLPTTGPRVICGPGENAGVV